MYRLAEALAEVLDRAGVTVHTGAPVKTIRCDGRRATGLELVDGTVIQANVVISNVDIATTMRYLVPPEARAPGTLERLAALEPSLSGFVLLLGVDRRYDHLLHHTVFFSENSREEFHDIFDRLVAPRDPTIYVCATTRTDPTQAPPGCENLFVLVNAPYLSNELNWAAERESYRALILEKLERMGLTDLRQHIVFERIFTPEDMASRYGAQRGAIYGFSSNSLAAPFTRPQNRSRDVRGLYFAGGSVHPGGGVPLVMLSGKIVAELVQHDWGEA